MKQKKMNLFTPYQLCLWMCSHVNSVTSPVNLLITCNSFVFFVDDSEAADLWLLNSCTVKNPSEDNFRNAIKRAQELDKHLVVAGCVPQGQPRHQSIKGISVIGVSKLYLLMHNKTLQHLSLYD